MPDDEADALPRILPPGQKLVPALSPQHYGRVPSRSLERWNITVSGATADGSSANLSLEDIYSLPHVVVEGDMHCVAHWSVQDLQWGGTAARSLFDLVPPADTVSHVLVIAEYGFSATLRLSDFLSPRTVLAWELDGRPLPKEHGYPLRLVAPHLYAFKSVKWVRGFEYLNGYRPGFWESRGYHHDADAWREQRYAYQP